MVKTATIYRNVFEKGFCPHGLKAKLLLKSKGFHVEDHHLTCRAEIDAFKAEHHIETTPQIFIDGHRIGGYDDLRRHFGQAVPDKSKTTYRPIIAIFAVTALMALALAFAQNAIAPLPLLMNFVAFSMCVLAIQKLRDLESFTTQFISYDLLGQKYLPYAYIYPFAEAFVGIGMLAGTILTPIIAPIALFIGGIGAVSVVKAVYIDKRDLKCACVGGNSNVPLGFVSLTENVMMVVVSLIMVLSL